MYRHTVQREITPLQHYTNTAERGVQYHTNIAEHGVQYHINITERGTNIAEQDVQCHTILVVRRCCVYMNTGEKCSPC